MKEKEKEPLGEKREKAKEIMSEMCNRISFSSTQRMMITWMYLYTDVACDTIFPTSLQLGNN